MKNQFIWMGTVIGFAIVVLGFCLKSGIEAFVQKDRFVSVKGLCEMEVKSDHVIWPIKFQEKGDNLGHLLQVITTKNKEVVNYLVSKGINESEISISSPDVYDGISDRYSYNPSVRYTVTSVITISSDKIDLIRNLLLQQIDLLNKGITLVNDYSSQPNFSFNGLNDIKPQMIETATKNARAAAMKFAEDSGSTLGKIKSASQGTFSISERDSNTPYMKQVRIVTYVDYYLND
ncbi:MAG: SIMPL domain-containing protein [Paludibacteraceae bacterium]|nr:SIMPL domain-containing protein [Paludibacteraceae bacterium]